MALGVHLDVGDLAVGEADDAICHRGRHRVVGDDRGRRPEIAVHSLDRLEHDDARLAVERAGGFVAEQDPWTLRDGPGDGDALLLAARELSRKVIDPLAEPDQGARFGPT